MAMNRDDSTPTPRSVPTERSYVRPRAPHVTMPPVDDLAVDDPQVTDTTHDSDYTVSSRNPVAGLAYRRSRNTMPQLQRDLKYGQYLQMPKGRKSIFSSIERKRHQRSVAIGVAIIVALLLIAFILWRVSVG